MVRDAGGLLCLLCRFFFPVVALCGGGKSGFRPRSLSSGSPFRRSTWRKAIQGIPRFLFAIANHAPLRRAVHRLGYLPQRTLELRSASAPRKPSGPIWVVPSQFPFFWHHVEIKRTNPSYTAPLSFAPAILAEHEAHNGAWWRQWWEKNKERYPAAVRAMQIPQTAEESVGWALPTIFPREDDTVVGRAHPTAVVRNRNELGQAKGHSLQPSGTVVFLAATTMPVADHAEGGFLGVFEACVVNDPHVAADAGVLVDDRPSDVRALAHTQSADCRWPGVWRCVPRLVKIGPHQNRVADDHIAADSGPLDHHAVLRYRPGLDSSSRRPPNCRGPWPRRTCRRQKAERGS